MKDIVFNLNHVPHSRKVAFKNSTSNNYCIENDPTTVAIHLFSQYVELESDHIKYFTNISTCISWFV